VAEIRRLFDVTAVSELVPRYTLAPTQDLLMVSQDCEHVARLAPGPAGPSGPGCTAQYLQRTPRDGGAQPAVCRGLPGPPGAHFGQQPLRVDRGQGATPAARLHPQDGRSLVCAGLWAEQNGVLSCIILMTTSVSVFSGVHDRMPLLLPRDRWAAWLDPRTPLAQVWALANAAHDLHRVIHAYLVGAAVRKVRNNLPELAEPPRQLVTH
jgi:putative SOS response-associated peptidase YedK